MGRRRRVTAPQSVADTPTVSFEDSPADPPTVASPQQFLPGTLFGKRYRIVELLGRGGMGEVYRADDLQLGQTVALKFLPQSLIGDPTALTRLRNEVRVARQVAHPNVCRVYDIGAADGQWFLSMEYIDGEDLGSVLRRLGRPTRDKSLEIARQLCAGLAAAHETGVLHRDLKPANVMIDGRGRVRITDFGLAGFARELTRPGRGGTPAYMAPELFAGGAPSTRTDIYALGTVLYELFTGRRAFDAATISDLRKQHERGAPTVPSAIVGEIDPIVEEIILRCLDKEPDMRPRTALAVAAVLPGADLVAAALAAGQTPSPEMVAAAGGAGALRPGVAVVCFLAVLAGLMLIASLNRHVSLHGLAPPAKPAVILADRARQILERLGHREAPADTAYGWETYLGYLRHIEESDPRPERWTELGDRRPPVYWLWYRESPVSLAATNFEHQIRFSDPPQTLPGMAGIKLDDRGRLAVLRVVPPQRADELATGSEPVDYTWLFEAAGLDPSDFVEADPRWNPPDYADARRAWTGHYPGQPDWSLRVEAASYRGRTVYFNVLEAFDEPWTGPRDRRTMLQRTAVWFSLALLALALVVPPLVARRNLRRGTGDRIAAVRLGVAIWLLALVSWVLWADHTSNTQAEVGLFLFALGISVLIGVWSFLVYLALEPYVRRLWPETMISWTRLMLGRFGDARVGRDVLLGALAGVLVIVIQRLEWLVPTWFGVAPRLPYDSANAAFLGGRKALAIALEPAALFNPLTILLLMTVLLLVLRRHGLAVGGTLVVLGMIDGHWMVEGGGLLLWSGVIEVVLVWSTLLFVLVRFGLLSLVTAFFFFELLQRAPLTLDLSLWFSGISLAALLVLAVIAALAMRVSLGGLVGANGLAVAALAPGARPKH